MSLFENDNYRWRETYFVLLRDADRPPLAKIKQALVDLGKRYDISEPETDEAGHFEALTVMSPYDFSAMDICYATGEDVVAQIEEMIGEMKQVPLSDEERQKLGRLAGCNARFEIYHFEQLMDEGGEDEFLDPGALLIVLEQLAELCQGVGVDPQFSTLM